MKKALPSLAIIFAVIFMFGAFKPTGNEVKEDKELPNIVWLVCEDQSMFFSMYGDSTSKTPNLDRLASEGVIFTNTFSPAPVCSPARSTIITGMYQTTLGTHNMRCYNPWNNKGQPEINIPNYSPRGSEDARAFTEYLREAGYYCTNNPKEDYNFRTLESMWDESSKQASHRNRPSGAPFFAVYNFDITHESQIWKRGKKKLRVNPDDVPVPPYFPNDSITRHDLAVNYSNIEIMDRQVGKILQQLEEDDLLDNTYIFFYSDHGGPFPRHKRSIYMSGLQVPMIVRYPGATRKGTDEAMFSFIDLAPTVLALAGIEQPSQMPGRAILKDEFKNDSQRPIFAATDRFDECYDRKRSVIHNGFQYIINYRMNVPYALPVGYRRNMPMMCNLEKLDSLGQLDKFQSLWMAKTKPEEELYDLQNDPNELNNLANDPKYSDKVKAMRKLITDWQKETKDLGGKDEQKLVKKWVKDGTSEQLKSPSYTIEGKKLILSNPNKKATLIASINQGTWFITNGEYIQPPEGSSIRFKCVQIGYDDSEVVEYKP